VAHYTWTVIGAGPAGIASVGRLLDQGVVDDEIAWLDPEFAAGDLGGKWRAVPSNTSVAQFLDFLTASPSFRFATAPAFELNDSDPQQTCVLGLVADPLVWISNQLRGRVRSFRDCVTELALDNGQWTLRTRHDEITSKNVILATGSIPRKLSYPGLEEIPIETVLDPRKLARLHLDGATVAVFGSSHSTMIALPNLLSTPVEKVINFYRSPLKYAIPFEGSTLYDDTGLKGHAARWARANIDGKCPPRLERQSLHGNEFQESLRTCDHVVYTVGFERRGLPVTPQWGPLEYDTANGILAPGLFGIGIAFPEYRIELREAGHYRIGLAKFMQRLDDVLPVWMCYGT
jgi:cation diffusion facilitator CzcD-associated flavoprotein CzcO